VRRSLGGRFLRASEASDQQGPVLNERPPLRRSIEPSKAGSGGGLGRNQQEINPMSAPIPSDVLEFDPELVHGYWVRVASAFIRSPRFTTTAKALYTLLLTYAGERCVAWPGQTTLCESLGVSKNTLRKALEELSAAGLVTTQRRGDGKTARYFVRKWTPDTEKQMLKICVSETSRCSKSEHLLEIETAYRNRDSGGYAGARTREKPPVREASAAAADDSKKDPEGEALGVSGGAAEDPKLNAPAGSKPAARRSSPSPSLPDGVTLIDAEPADIERLSPEEGLRRFRAEHPERWEKHRRFRQIEQNSSIRAPRVVQWQEAKAVLVEIRDQRQRDAEKPKRPAPTGPDPAALAAFAARNSHAYGGAR
jgi:predicted transcriptional regulator